MLSITDKSTLHVGTRLIVAPPTAVVVVVLSNLCSRASTAAPTAAWRGSRARSAAATRSRVPVPSTASSNLLHVVRPPAGGTPPSSPCGRALAVAPLCASLASSPRGRGRAPCPRGWHHATAWSAGLADRKGLSTQALQIFSACQKLLRYGCERGAVRISTVGVWSGSRGRGAVQTTLRPSARCGSKPPSDHRRRGSAAPSP